MTPEARAARERKQKIFVVVGGLFLVAMLAFQLPKLLGGSSSPEAAPTETTTTPGAVTPATPGVATPVANRSPLVTTTKLSSFSGFKRKDPFVQQVVTQNGLEDAAPAKEGADDAKGEQDKSQTEKFATGEKHVATVVTVNGVRQVLEPGTKFPAADPTFVLVAEKPGSKSIVVGIAGGAYSGGGKTTTLKVGAPVTLVNTTTGARYRITLVSVGTGDDAKQPPAKQ